MAFGKTYVPFRDLRRQMETLLQTYCFEIEVTCTQASAQDAFVKRMALHLVQYLAVFLAFFFPALPDKCETWSVNNWNEPVIENKFPQRKKPTTNPTKNNKNKQHTHTSQGTSQAKQSGKFAN